MHLGTSNKMKEYDSEHQQQGGSRRKKKDRELRNDVEKRRKGRGDKERKLRDGGMEGQKRGHSREERMEKKERHVREEEEMFSKRCFPSVSLFEVRQII